MFETAPNKNIIPHTWTMGNIVHIPKFNEETNKGTSYRTISILSVIAKTLEKSILSYITANTPMQDGYKIQHYTVTALHTLNNTIAKRFNQMAPPAQTITVALDICNDFDTINIHTLIRKLLQTNLFGLTPHYSKHLHQISPRCLTHYTIGHRGQLNTHYHQTIYPSSPQLIFDMTTDYNKTDEHSPTTRKLTGHNLRESAFPQTTIHTNIHAANIIFTNIILMTDKHNIPKGKMHSNCRFLPKDIVCKIIQRNNIRRTNTCDPVLKFLNEEITSDIQKHKQNIWKKHLDAH